MRIIAGKWKKRRLYSPEGDEIRPTSDFMKERIFSIISEEIDNAMFLDLFAGTGAMGIEALSRGADKVVFIDNNPYAINLINKNLPDIDNAYVFKESLPAGLKKVCGGMKFDIVFMDPPYTSNLVTKTLRKIEPYLNNGALVICEFSSEFPPDIPDIFLIEKNIKHRKINISFYRYKNENN